MAFKSNKGTVRKIWRHRHSDGDLDYSTAQKFGHSFWFSVFSLFSLFSTLWTNAENIKTTAKQVWIFLPSKKLHLLRWQLCAPFAWNGFPAVLKEFPEFLNAFWLLFRRTAVELIPDHLGLALGWVIVEARSSEAVVHPSASWWNSPDQAWEVCLGVTVSLKNNGWLHEARTILRIAAECCGSRDG